MWQAIRRWFQSTGWTPSARMRLIDEAETMIVDVILEYRNRLTGGNRFLINKQIIREILDDQITEEELHAVWKRLVTKQYVAQDPIDGEWCVRGY